MARKPPQPRIFRILRAEALRKKRTPFGDVGTLFRGEGIEAVWVSKRGEAIDPGWFAQAAVDLILVVSGRLRVEYENPRFKSQVLRPGDLLVLPAKTRCRAYGWPRSSRRATIFFAAYPKRRR